MRKSSRPASLTELVGRGLVSRPSIAAAIRSATDPRSRRYALFASGWRRTSYLLLGTTCGPSTRGRPGRLPRVPAARRGCPRGTPLARPWGGTARHRWGLQSAGHAWTQKERLRSNEADRAHGQAGFSSHLREPHGELTYQVYSRLSYQR